MAQSPTGELIRDYPGRPWQAVVAIGRRISTWGSWSPIGAGPCPYQRVGAADVRQLRRMMYLDPETGLPELDERIVELVRRYRAGATVRELAELARVSKSVIGRILKGDARLSFDAADLSEILAA
jgi:hypothetical protein